MNLRNCSSTMDDIIWSSITLYYSCFSKLKIKFNFTYNTASESKKNIQYSDTVVDKPFWNAIILPSKRYAKIWISGRNYFQWKAWTPFVVNFDISMPNFRKFWNFWQFSPFFDDFVMYACHVTDKDYDARHNRILVSPCESSDLLTNWPLFKLQSG